MNSDPKNLKGDLFSRNTVKSPHLLGDSDTRSWELWKWWINLQKWSLKLLFDFVSCPRLPYDACQKLLHFNCSHHFKLTHISRIWLSASQTELDEKSHLIAKGERSVLVKQYFSIESLSETILPDCWNVHCSESKQYMAGGSDINVLRAWDRTMKIFPI